MVRIKKDYAWAIYDLAETLYNDIKEFVKENGGLIDCQDGVFGAGDVICGYNCFGGNNGDSVEEEYIYALKVDGNDDLYACFVPCTEGVKVKWAKEDYEKTFADPNNTDWHYIGRDSDSVLFVPTILDIAEFIEEYKNA